jgi:HEAT repeat protein
MNAVVMRQPSLMLSDAEQSRVAEIHRLQDAADVRALLPCLDDDSWAVRREAVAALSQLGQSAVRPLCEALKNGRDNEARIAAAVDALAASSADVLGEVTELAKNPQAAVVADAAQVLGRRRSTKAVPLLAGLVQHPDDNVAVAAIEALGRVGARGGVDPLIAAVNSGNFFRVFPAIDVLGRSADPRAIAPLAALLESSTYVLEAARALGRTGETAAVPHLARLLNHKSEVAVRVAAVALSELRTRHIERYGRGDAPDDALRKEHPGEPAIRRLVHSLSGADTAEQVALAYVLGTLGGESAIAGLRELLDAPRVVAEAATQGLRGMSRDSDQQIRQALREGSSTRRQVLLRVVARASATNEVTECLKDPDATVRALACDALARVGAWAAVPALFPLLADDNPRVVQAAIGAIQSLGSDHTRRLALETAQHKSPQVRRAAFRVLAYFGFNEALPLFLGALESPDQRLRDAAIGGLAFLDLQKALDALLDCARSGEAKTRSAAMRALGQSIRTDARIAAALLLGIRDSDAWVRYYACQALGRLKIEGATPALVPLLADEAGQVRVSAVEALSHFTNAEALEALRRSAEGEDADMQRAALIGLGASKRTDAYPILLKATKSPDAATRLLAISAVAETGSAHVLPALSVAVRDPDDNVRAAAIGFVASVPTPEATALLVDLLRDGRDEGRIVECLSVENEGRVAGLVAALETADEQLAPWLTSALTRMQTFDAREALFKLMTAQSVPARKAAASALAAMRNPAAYGMLRHAAESDPDARVRQICIVLLSQ